MNRKSEAAVTGFFQRQTQLRRPLVFLCLPGDERLKHWQRGIYGVPAAASSADLSPSKDVLTVGGAATRSDDSYGRFAV
jgi:hypothetical protein